MKTVLCAVTIAIFSSAWANAQTIADIARQERAKNRLSREDGRQQQVARHQTPDYHRGKPSTDPRPEDPRPPPPPQRHQRQRSGHGSRRRSRLRRRLPICRPPRDEKWWRSRFEDARIEVRRAENQVAVAQLELNAANRDFLTRALIPIKQRPRRRGRGYKEAGWDAGKKP